MSGCSAGLQNKGIMPKIWKKPFCVPACRSLFHADHFLKDQTSSSQNWQAATGCLHFKCKPITCFSAQFMTSFCAHPFLHSDHQCYSHLNFYFNFDATKWWMLSYFAGACGSSVQFFECSNLEMYEQKLVWWLLNCAQKKENKKKPFDNFVWKHLRCHKHFLWNKFWSK